MTTKQALLLAAAMIPLAGCGPLAALHPLYEDSNLVSSDPRFEGTWRMADDDAGCTLSFSFVRENSHRMTCTSNGQPTKSGIHLLQLGGYRFLDFSAEDTGDFQIPVHVFAKVVAVSADEIQFSVFGTDWLEDQIQTFGFTPFAIAGRSESDVVLTGSTQELQPFVLSYAADPRAFEKEPTVLRKVQ